MAYKVDLDIYNGPLDLLLYLIKREEVDICDIAIARIADQYIAYLDMLTGLDIELAADFVVMAATLMELKSRALLPRPPEVDEEAEDEEDPRETLIRQLIEYRRFKEAAGMLGDRGREMARRFPRQVDEASLRDIAGEEIDLPAEELFQGVELWDLFTAFSQVVRTLGYSRPREVVYDETPAEEAAQELLARLQAERSVLFTQLFDKGRNLGYLVTMFLALLELMRQRLIGAEQTADFQDISLFLRDPETETYRKKKPKGAAASADGLGRKRPRRPTAHQRRAVREMMDEAHRGPDEDEGVELEKTEFDEILDSIEVPEIERHHPMYSDDELLGRKSEEPPGPPEPPDTDQEPTDSA